MLLFDHEAMRSKNMIVKTSGIPWLPFHIKEKSKIMIEIDFALRIHPGINSGHSGENNNGEP